MSLCIDNIQSDFDEATIATLSVLEDDGFDLLTRALADVSHKRIVVLYDPGAIAIARAFAANHPPLASLATWKKQANMLVTTYRLNRHRMVFASAAAVKAAPKQFRNSLSQYFKVSRAAGTIKVQPVVSDLSAWQLVLASQTIAADAEAALLDRELEAAALPLPPIFYDIDEAFTELKAAASIRDMLLRQLANVQSELRTYFLSAVAVEVGRTAIIEKSGRLEQSSNGLQGDSTQNVNDNLGNKVENGNLSALAIGRISLNEYLCIDENNYAHLDISLYDVQEYELVWSHIKFKFCSWNGQKEYLEFRNNLNLPTMFHVWPGQQEDQFGLYLNCPDPNTGKIVEISDIRDRKLVRLICNVLERVVDGALSTANVKEVDKFTWLVQANRLASILRDPMASSNEGDKVSFVTQ